MPIFLIYKSILSANISVPKKIQIRNIYEFAQRNLYTAFDAINFDYLENLDCDEAFEELHLKILSTFNHFCPIKNETISPKDVRKFWINYDTKTMIKKRQNLFILFKKINYLK